MIPGAERFLQQTRVWTPQQILPIIGREGSAPTLMIGCDPARFGVDANTLWLRTGNWIISGARWMGLDTNQNARLLADLVIRWEEAGWIVLWACIDVIGVGAGVVDTLWATGERFKTLVKPINTAIKSTQPRRYKNARAEIAWNLRQRFRNHDVWFLNRRRFPDLPPGMGVETEMLDRLERQATTIQYQSDEQISGMIKLESKKNYKDRTEGAESPDEFDGIVMVFNDSFAGLERRPASAGGDGSIMSR